MSTRADDPARRRQAQKPRTITRTQRCSEMVAAVYCLGVCIGMEHRDEQVEVYRAATAEMRSAANAGKSSLPDMIRAVWRVVEPIVRTQEPRRWDVRKVLHQLVDVPISAAMFAAPAGLAVFVLFAAVGWPAVGLGLGLVVATIALVTRGLYVLRRKIQLAQDAGLLERFNQPDARNITWANMMTVVRFVPLGLLAPILAAQGHLFGATVVFALAVLADSLDGYLARTLDHVTRTGAVLDALADRLVVVAGAIGLLLAPGALPIAALAITWCVIVRDALVAVLGVVFYSLGEAPRPNRAGHAASAMAMAGVSGAYLSLSSDSFDRGDLQVVSWGLLAGSVLVGLASLWQYRTTMVRSWTTGRTGGFGEWERRRSWADAVDGLVLGLDGELLALLSDLDRDNDDDHTPYVCAKDALERDGIDLAAAMGRGDWQSVGRLEERSRNLHALLRRLR